ncbi:GNAT family N-acetyltransferase [Metabacillus sp. DBTR6]|uniref:GNAT family N-acetyltransferase n=1 Tax=Metabacillus rhizolycopersici TaxID=2875709 RepID=A0ABS7UV57_9BACI|nr:GNAT family N-acetyltransferase [Metabacillus rhizolycopersici]MBZ5752197.1 GNAT family N-acetyltransferase [Metabacillus rhizolycopersici]
MVVIEIRLSKKNDFEQLIDLDHRIWSPNITPGTIKWNSVNEFAIRNPEGSQVVALVDGEVVGYLGFQSPTPLGTNQHVKEIDIAVDPRFQARGIGKQLIEKGKTIAKEKGLRKLSLRVLATNKGAIEFYKKCGFIEQGKLINEFLIGGKYVDDYLMYMLLN